MTQHFSPALAKWNSCNKAGTGGAPVDEGPTLTFKKSYVWVSFYETPEGIFIYSHNFRPSDSPIGWYGPDAVKDLIRLLYEEGFWRVD